MVSKRRIIGLIAVSILVIGCTACSGNRSDKKKAEVADTTSNSKLTESKDKQKNVLGNTNGNLANGGNVIENNGKIYYGLTDGLYSAKEDGTDKKKLCSPVENHEWIGGISVVDDWIYFAGAGAFRIKANGDSLEQVSAERENGSIWLMGDKLYHGIEYKMNFDGSDKERIYDKNSASGYTKNFADGMIYFYDTDLQGEDGLFQMKEDGSELRKIFDGRADHMIVDNGWIYFQNHEDHKYLYKMKTDGSDVQLIVETDIMSLNVDDDWIYYNGKVDGKRSLCKVKVDSTENQVLMQQHAVDLQIVGDWIYYFVNGESTDNLYRIKKDGTQQELFAQVGEVEKKLQKEDTQVKDEKAEMNLTYSTKFGEVNAITYPKFTFNYSKNWTVSQNVTGDREEVILTNTRGVQIKYTYLGGVAEGNLDTGGSSVSMSRVEVSSVAESNFMPGYVQATDYSNLGKFMVAKLKVTGQLDMKLDSDFTDVDGTVSYAVLPESLIGINDSVRGPFESEFSFWYSGYISFIASAPDGEFTEQEEKEVIEILSSFRGE